MSDIPISHTRILASVVAYPWRKSGTSEPNRGCPSRNRTSARPAGRSPGTSQLRALRASSDLSSRRRRGDGVRSLRQDELWLAPASRHLDGLEQHTEAGLGVEVGEAA